MNILLKYKNEDIFNDIENYFDEKNITIDRFSEELEKKNAKDIFKLLNSRIKYYNNKIGIKNSNKHNNMSNTFGNIKNVSAHDYINLVLNIFLKNIGDNKKWENHWVLIGQTLLYLLNKINSLEYPDITKIKNIIGENYKNIIERRGPTGYKNFNDYLESRYCRGSRSYGKNLKTSCKKNLANVIKNSNCKHIPNTEDKRLCFSQEFCKELIKCSGEEEYKSDKTMKNTMKEYLELYYILLTNRYYMILINLQKEIYKLNQKFIEDRQPNKIIDMRDIKIEGPKIFRHDIQNLLK